MILNKRTNPKKSLSDSSYLIPVIVPFYLTPFAVIIRRNRSIAIAPAIPPIATVHISP